MQHHEQRQRTHDLLQKQGIPRALFTTLDSVKWLTGFAPAVQLGHNYFAGGPPLVWYEAGHYTIVVQDGQAASLSHLAGVADCTVMPYLGYTIEQPIDGQARLREVLEPLLRKSGGRGALGVEEGSATLLLQQLLDSRIIMTEPDRPDHAFNMV